MGLEMRVKRAILRELALKIVKEFYQTFYLLFLLNQGNSFDPY